MLQNRRETENHSTVHHSAFPSSIPAQNWSKRTWSVVLYPGFGWQNKASTPIPMYRSLAHLGHTRGQPRTHLVGLQPWHNWWMPMSIHYIFIRSLGLASDREVIKCSGARGLCSVPWNKGKEAARPIWGRNKSIYFLKEPVGSFLITGCPAHITNWEKVEKHTQKEKKKIKAGFSP